MTTITKLKAALAAMNSAHVTCESAHHAKKDRGHAFGDCPVVTRYAVAMSGLDDVIAEMEAGEQTCFCDEHVSLQMVSGGGAPEGYLGKVTLRIGDQYRDYYTHPQPKAEPVQEPVYIRRDQLQKARVSPLLCDIGPEPRQDKVPLYAAPQAKPLTDQAIEALAVEHEDFGFGRVDAYGITTHGFGPEGLRNFARAIEQAHGIGGEK